MINYSHEQLTAIVGSIINKNNFSITPVGNHELKRHLVYIINDEVADPLVLKLYYKTNRRSREIAALRLLSDSDVKCSRIVKYGELKDGTEWLLYEYIEGMIFDKIMDSIPEDNRIGIFEEMGMELGKIHSFRKFNFFGNWDQYGRSIENIKSCIVNFIISMEYSVRDIQSQELPESELFKKAIMKMRNGYTILNDINESRLRHNDFDGRNILVRMDKGVWRLSGVLDFEQSTPGNIEADIISLYHKYFLDNSVYEKAFFKGYNKYWHLPPEFYNRIEYYLLCQGLEICSWAYEQAYDYFLDGLKLVRMFGS